MAAIGKTNKLSACPVAVKTLAGEKYWLEAYATTIDVLGRKSILSCLVDANDRYQAEQALRHAKKTFDRAQRIAEMGSWEWNIVSNEVSWSDQIYRMFGYPVGAVSPTFSMFMAHVHEDDRELVETAIKNALDNFAPYDINHRIVLADGRIKILHEQGEIECNDHGEPVRMLGAVQDITALCQTEEALRRSQLTLSGILNISPEAMIVTNEEGRITIFSAGAEAIFGYASEEMVGRRVEWLMPERFRMRHRDLIGEFDASRTVSKQMGERQEIVGLRKNGEEFPAKASLSKLITPDGTYFTTILRDVTAEKRHEADLTDARKRAESASEAKSAFLATMSHELRTPLNGVLGAAQILRNQNLDETALEWVNMINDSGENLLVLLNDILDICRIEEGKLSIAEEEFDILQLFDSVIAPRRLIAGEKAVELTLEMSFRNTYYKGDPKRIRQILTNLINNAIKFTDRGEIRVAAKVEVNDGAAVLCCSVTDTGCGIPKEFQAKIFERFAQVEDGRTRTHDGVGLGLAICNELVRAMGGTISLESEPGRGSLFSFRIPLQFVDEEHQSPDAPEGIWPAASARMSDKKPVALIVDDQAINRTVISTFVRTFGVEALEASSGAEALELCKTTGFDIILMDIHMPGMCGQETLARLRAGDSPNKSTPIIAVTADAMLGDRQKYLDNGFEAYLSKPVKAPELKRALSEFIDLNIIEPSNRVSEVRPTKSASG
ncbi:ATP-binding protein [Hyphococcus sp.]|uniref:ATP-binding protein n=1 Tax=Hyphococcus sp. TaxID=2038636 RepID=UPI003D0D9B6C